MDLEDLMTNEEIHSILDIMNQNELDQQVKDAVPKATVNKQNWAIKLFQDWLAEWRVRTDGIKVLKEMQEFTPSDLNFCLKFFFAEVRKINGAMYPPQTLKELGSCIQHYFNNVLNWHISIFTDNDFSDTRQDHMYSISELVAM